MALGRREASVSFAIVALGAVLAVAAPGFFARDNLADLFLASLPVLIAALGATLVIVTGHIDISVGSAFAVCAVGSGLLAKAGLPLPLVALAACAAGALLGCINGALTAYLRIPAIVVTLATMIVWREGLRWATEGAWVQDLPASYQWLGTSAPVYLAFVAVVVVVLYAAMSWGLRHLWAGRAVYAIGSSPRAAELAGIRVETATFLVFAVAGALTGLAALLNSVRFNQIPSNTGLGLELKVIAAVVVGGAAITGGRGSIAGTLLGVVLLAAIGPALTFLGVSAYWERAVQGAIILTAVTVDALRPSGAGRRDAPEGAGVRA
jgi:rhamnose transport system permease protein